jgi:hypothetical protein
MSSMTTRSALRIYNELDRPEWTRSDKIDAVQKLRKQGYRKEAITIKKHLEETK